MARTVGYQAITTKFLAPTNNRGSRIKATAEAGSLTVSWDYGLDASANHEIVAQALADRYGWTGELVGGATRTGYVFVFTGRGV
jgi:hypothetical protein